MFAVGDMIVYPMHGAGIIEKIEDRTILNETRPYYIVKVSYADITIMVPVENCESVGVRPIINGQSVKDVMCVLSAESSEMPSNWNRRYRENIEKLKTGDIMEVAEVVRNLVRSDRIRKLSTGEKKLLTNAKQILLSEIVLAGNLDINEAGTMIEGAI